MNHAQGMRLLRKLQDARPPEKVCLLYYPKSDGIDVALMGVVSVAEGKGYEGKRETWLYISDWQRSDVGVGCSDALWFGFKFGPKLTFDITSDDRAMFDIRNESTGETLSLWQCRNKEGEAQAKSDKLWQAAT